MRELLELMVKSLVDRPDDVVVSEIADGQATVYELKVAGDDLGKVIGKQGKTARAMRTILASAGAKARKRIVLEIVE